MTGNEIFQFFLNSLLCVCYSCKYLAILPLCFTEIFGLCADSLSDVLGGL